MTCIQKTDLNFKILQNAGFMCQRFVKHAALIRAKERIENIPKISISAHELESSIRGFHRIPFSKLSKIFERIRKKPFSIYYSISYFKTHCLLRQWCQSKEHAKYHLYQATEVPIRSFGYSMGSERQLSKESFYKISYTGSVKAHNHSLVSNLFWAS